MARNRRRGGGTVDPDHGGHAPGDAIPAVGIEPFGIAQRAPFPAADISNANRCEFAPGDRVQVQQVAVAPAGESRFELIRKSLRHLLPHLVGPRADGRAQPGQQVAGCSTQGADRGLQDPCGQSSPARVCNADPVARAIAENHRQAVRRQHRADPAGPEGHQSIAFLFPAHRSAVLDNAAAMNLAQPLDRCRKRPFQPGAVHRHPAPIVAAPPAQVQAGPGASADAAHPARAKRADIRRRRPAGPYPAVAHAGLLRSTASNSWKSSGSGAS